MLVQFTLENYRSVKDSVTFDLQALNKVHEKTEHIIEKFDDKILPFAVIFGANGSGKSTIVNGLTQLREIILGEIPLTSITPYYFSEEKKKESTTFELVFTVNENEYRYIIKILSGKIEYESLEMVRFSTGRKSLLFERKKNEYHFGRCFINLKILSELYDQESLFKVLYDRYPGNDILSETMNFIKNEIDYIGTKDMAEHILPDIFKKDKVWDLFRQMLQELDLDIKEVKVVGEHVIVIHQVKDTCMHLPLAAESNGIRELLTLLPKIADSLLSGKVLIADESIRGLHPNVLKHIIGYFINNESNKFGAQLLMTSCDISILKKEFLRRDEIWFAAKNEEQSTILYSLADFSKFRDNRKTVDYDKRYLDGVYGANPYIRDTINWTKFFGCE